MSTIAIIAIVIGALILLVVVFSLLNRGKQERDERRRGEAREHGRRAKVHGARAEREKAAAQEKEARAKREAAEARERQARADRHAEESRRHGEHAEQVDPDR